MNEHTDIFTHHETKDTDTFDEVDYPQVVGEIAGLHRSLSRIRGVQKARAIIALLKDDTIKNEWLNESREFTTFLTTGLIPMPHLESLFIKRKDDTKFTEDLEAYITAKLS